ncbi:hypothetical protein Hanom_Chr16g01435921 [Helianthus anomalus]
MLPNLFDPLPNPPVQNTMEIENPSYKASSISNTFSSTHKLLSSNHETCSNAA